MEQFRERRETSAGELEVLGREILQETRRELYLSMQFFDMAFGSLTFRMDRRVFFLGTDGEVMYFNPVRLGERYLNSPISVQRAYLHTVLHCVFGHMFYDDDRAMSGQEELWNQDRWNLACDIVVEYIIDQLDYPCVRQPVSEKRSALYEALEQEYAVLTAEAVYHYLTEHPEWEREELLFLVDSHDYWKMQDRQQEQKDHQEKQKQQRSRDNPGWERRSGQDRKREQKLRWAKVSEQLKISLDTFQRSKRKEAMALYQELAVQNTPRQDYETFLNKFAVVREEMRVDMDSFDYMFYHFGIERYGNMPLLEPLEYRESVKIHELVIVLDTSGSCSGKLIHDFLERTLNLLQSGRFAGRMQIHVLQCDDRVNEDIVIHNREEARACLANLVVRGHGNTDYRPAFEYVEKLRREGILRRLQGMLYFTDGYGIYPAKRPDYDVAFVFTQEDFGRPPVPSWAMETVLPAGWKPDGAAGSSRKSERENRL